jgi:DNA-binding MarR family transcriptional regulator
MRTTRFDTIIHAPNRLQICAFPAPLKEAEFKVLHQELDVSDFVLPKHIRQLEEAGYVEQRKSTVNGRQRTWASLTGVGRTAFEQHVEELKRLVTPPSE